VSISSHSHPNPTVTGQVTPVNGEAPYAKKAKYGTLKCVATKNWRYEFLCCE